MSEPKIKALQCKECEHQYPAKALHVCEFCFGPLEVVYDYDAIKKRVSRASIEKGPRSLWRYWDFLPVETRDVITLQEGLTPFWHAKHLGEVVGLKNLYIKNDSVNPTFSFKDRVAPTLRSASTTVFPVPASSVLPLWPAHRPETWLGLPPPTALTRN